MRLIPIEGLWLNPDQVIAVGTLPEGSDLYKRGKRSWVECVSCGEDGARNGNMHCFEVPAEQVVEMLTGGTT